MENPESTEETGVQEPEGKPVAEPASKETGQAEKDGVVTLDVTKKYRSRRNPAKEVSGDELWAGFSRGQNFDKLQSEHQKLQADTASKDERIAALEAQVRTSATKEQIAQSLQELGVTGGQKPTAEPDDANWLEQPTEEPVQLDPRTTASRMEAIMKKTAKEYMESIRPELSQELTGINQQELEQRQLQEQRQQAADQVRRNKIAALRVNYPDIPEAEINDLANRITEYTGHIYSAVDNYAAKNMEQGNEALFDGEEKLLTLLQKQEELGQKQKAITAENERNAELEGLSTGTLPGEEPEEEQKSEYNWHKSQEKRESRLAKAKRISDRQATLKTSGM
jgi:hypothetical protein